MVPAAIIVLVVAALAAADRMNMNRKIKDLERRVLLIELILAPKE